MPAHPEPKEKAGGQDGTADGTQYERRSRTMRYIVSDRPGGKPVIAVSAGELCPLDRLLPLPAGDVRRLSGMLPVSPSRRIGCDIEKDGTVFRIYGTADGVIDGQGGDPPAVAEFRTSGRAGQPSDRSLLFAYMLCRNLGAEKAGITVFSTDRELSAVSELSEKTYAAGELEKRVDAMLARALPAARDLAQRSVRRAASGGKTPFRFPFPSLREGQRELIENVYTAVKNGERLFAEAPTGIGKTVSVLYGAARALYALGEGKIFYLTAKNSTTREAFTAAAALDRAGADMRTLVLASKEQICPFAKGADRDTFVCDPETCPLMRNMTAGEPAALSSLLSKWKGFTPGAVAGAAAEHGICPHELSLDLSGFCDLIICDINYAVSPAVRLRRYFGSERAAEEKFIFLSDEAHNLPDRARDTFSAELRPEDTAALESLLPETAGAAAVPGPGAPRGGTDGLNRQDRDEPAPAASLSSLLAALRTSLEGLASFCGDTSVKDENGDVSGYFCGSEPPAAVDAAVRALLPELRRFRAAHRGERELSAAASSLARKCTSWLDASSAFDRRYRTYISIDRGALCARLYCLDPSGRLGEALSASYSSVFFSATLTPPDYFSDLLAGGGGRSLSLPSPFPKENLFAAAYTALDTRWESRDGSGSVKKAVAVIAAACSAKKGNYIVFFPSYRYLDRVYAAFTEKYPKVATAVQRRGSGRGEGVSRFISFFTDDDRLKVGFCVLGGAFSEGIDLPGRKLIGTVIIGVGLPGISAERNMIREYYDSRSECGYDYAYTYPGLIRVLQAAGRVIRRPDDRGVVILADDRYADPKYRSLMPPHMSEMRYTSDILSLQAGLRSFWNGEKMPLSE